MEKRQLLRTANKSVHKQTNSTFLSSPDHCWIFPHERVLTKGKEQQEKIAIEKILVKILVDNKTSPHDQKNSIFPFTHNKVPSLSSPDHFSISPLCLMNFSSLPHGTLSFVSPSSLQCYLLPLLKEYITKLSTIALVYSVFPKSLVTAGGGGVPQRHPPHTPPPAEDRTQSPKLNNNSICFLFFCFVCYM